MALGLTRKTDQLARYTNKRTVPHAKNQDMEWFESDTHFTQAIELQI